MPEYYIQGEDAAIRIRTTDIFTGALADPNPLVVEVRRHGAISPETYTFGSSPEISRTPNGASQGDFILALPTPTIGIYHGTVLDTVAGSGGKIAAQTFVIEIRPRGA